MVWSPEGMSERDEIELMNALRSAVDGVPIEAREQWLREYLLSNKERVLGYEPDNPARVKLEEILRREELGFAG